jgi:hypothetical protein
MTMTGILIFLPAFLSFSFFYFAKMNLKEEQKPHLPKGISHRRQQAARAPADAPLILSNKRWGAYFLKQTATPT